MNVDRSFVVCRTALSSSKLPGLRYSLNPYLGCEHGCIYCYSRSVFKDETLALSWGKFVQAKRNIPEVLERELKRKPSGVVGLSTVTDPYQPWEAELKLTRRCLEALATSRFPVSIQTKSPLVLRDLDLIDPKRFDVGVTLITMDRELARKLEPRAPSPERRAQALQELSSQGVETWLFLGPVIPEVNDDEAGLREVIEVAQAAGSKLMYDKLNLRRWVLESLGQFLEQERPGLRERLPRLVARGSSYWRRLSGKIEGICREMRVPCEPAFPP